MHFPAGKGWVYCIRAIVYIRTTAGLRTYRHPPVPAPHVDIPELGSHFDPAMPVLTTLTRNHLKSQSIGRRRIRIWMS